MALTTTNGGDSTAMAAHSKAPDADSEEAVIQVYAARAARWRGAFGVHTWISTKRTDERAYTRLEVIGYRVLLGWTCRTGAKWHSRWDVVCNHPTLLREIRGGKRVDKLIDTMLQAAESYPYDQHYQVGQGLTVIPS